MHTGTQPCGNPAHNAPLAPLAEQLAAAVVLSLRAFTVDPDTVARAVLVLFMAIMAGGTIAALWRWIGRRD